MARTVGIGHQDFGEVIQGGCFYVDKTAFIKEWWESQDVVTLITRPRRFGKTLNMSMLDYFFSINHAGREDLFEGLSIWREEKYRQMQGAYPVISLSFARVKEVSFSSARKKICLLIKEQYNKYDFLLDEACLNEDEKEIFRKISIDMEDYIAAESLNILSNYLSRYYGKKVIILLDEYDTPMQEAYMGGYWREMVDFLKGFFNATFKTNPCLNRAVMTGITRVSKESVFSDLNNLAVVTTTADKYASAFGFTEEEVFAALDEYGMGDRKGNVKAWYDGFTFGQTRDIYNPWSILNFLDKGKFELYWVNTSSNALVGKLVREGSLDLKKTFEDLIRGKSFHSEIDEQIVYDALDADEQAVWSLLLASGYLKLRSYEVSESEDGEWKGDYELELTNFEVRSMFRKLIRKWFGSVKSNYNCFVRALLLGDVKAMNTYMNRVTAEIFSSFDTGTRPSGKEPERFYHGFVLGLIVELEDRYTITSNRESGFGRYDVVIEPRTPAGAEAAGDAVMNRCGRDAMIIEFKVQDEDEADLSDTVRAALRQIEEKNYQANLAARGIPQECIRKYGFAFCGKKVLIGAAGP